ncbi:MAG: TolC family protein [Puniceicoccales bacterium]|jgi:outer membrane protein TolC|nr:TolC family protein [Puniceicoccales bacterium]
MIFRLVPILLALGPVVLSAQEFSSTVAGEPVPQKVLSLREVADKALLRNLGIAVNRIDTDIVADSIDIAESVFDPTFTAETGWRRSLSAKPTDYSVSRSINDTWDSSLGISKKFSTGGTVSLATSLGTDWTNPSGIYMSPDNAVAFSIEGRQPLLSGAGRTVNLAPIAQARQNLTKSKLNLRKAVLDLLRDVEVAYWTLSANHALLQLRLSNLESAEALLKQAQARKVAGDGLKQDVLQAEADVASQRVAIINARQSIADAEDNLRLLLSEMNQVDPAPLATVELPQTAPESMPAFARWIPKVRSFDIDAQVRSIEIEQADLDVLVADNADQPSLDLIAGASALGRDRTVGNAYTGVFTRSGYGLNAGVELSIPLGFRESEARLRQARKAREQAFLLQVTTQQQTMFNARSAWRALETSRDRLAATQATVSLKREAYDGERAKYAVGASTMSDVLVAKASFDAAELSNLQSMLDCVVAAAAVARLDGTILSNLGFSWEVMDEQAGKEPPVMTYDNGTASR